jgi:hypothetical protein
MGDVSLRAALDEAARALFAIKRMKPDAVPEFAAEAHRKACVVLDAACVKSTDSVQLETCPWRARDLGCGDNVAAWCGDCPRRIDGVPPTRGAAVHFGHCYQGEYAHSCKYGDADCPAAGVKTPLEGRDG